jgi:hypothetical protein
VSDDRSFAFEIRYWLDKSDVIVGIDPGWDESARSNDAPDLESRRIVGRNLLTYIQGDATRMYVRTLIQAARLLRAPVVRNYRCDTPSMRRFMEMRLTVEEGGVLCWEHRLVRAEPMAYRVAFVPAGVPGGAWRPLVRCSVCNRVKSAAGWSEPDRLPETAAADMPVRVIYGVCPDCLAAGPGRLRRAVGGG